MHVREWPKVAKRLGLSATVGYESVPRGRVLYDTTNHRGIIYHGSATSPKRLVEIAARYQLNTWIAIPDPHYAFGDEIERLFADDP